MSDIKVGSEWVGKTGEKLTILAIDDGELFIKYSYGGHSLMSEKNLKTFCKPAPVRRTVWLNVYDPHVNVHLSKHTADLSKNDGLLFQQEVELIDPREGEKG